MSPIWIGQFIFSWAEMANDIGDKKIKRVNFPNSTFQAFFSLSLSLWETAEARYLLSPEDISQGHLTR